VANPPQLYFALTVQDLTIVDGYAMPKVASPSSANLQVGGGMLFTDVAGSVTLKRVHFDRCEAEDTGGAIFLAAPKIVSNKLHFHFLTGTVTNCTARSGGGIHGFHRTDSRINWVDFLSNVASDTGGAVDMIDSDVRYDNSTFVGNRAANAGALYQRGGYSQSTKVKFAQNMAGKGGAIAVSSLASFGCSECTFDGNHAMDSHGGAVLADQTVSTISFVNSVFTGNRAVGYGGAGFYSQAIVDHRNCRLSRNAAQYGGAATFTAGAEGEFHNGLLSQNSAEDGGAIHSTQRAAIELRGSLKVTDNSASNDGGAVYCSNSKLTIDKSVDFTGNSADSDDEVHCSTKVEGTECIVEGDHDLASICEIPPKPAVSGSTIALVVVFSLFGILCVGGSIFAYVQRERLGWTKLPDHSAGEEASARDSDADNAVALETSESSANESSDSA
jgi:predicted outer membrane repeat protein